MLFRWHFNLEQKRSLEVCTTFRASDFTNKNNNKNVNKNTTTNNNNNHYSEEGDEILFHRQAHYNSRLLDFENLPEPTNYFNRAFSRSNNNSSSSSSDNNNNTTKNKNNDGNFYIYIHLF